MNRTLVILTLLFFASCDNRDVGVYKKDSDVAFDATVVTHNGIEYMFMSSPFTEMRGWVVDYSQFFDKDTLIVNGNMWLRIAVNEEVKKEPTRVPKVEK